MAAVVAGSVIYSIPAVAADDTELEAVTITGTRIAKRDAVADSPILTVDRTAIENSGYTVVEQYLNTLPQIAPGLSSQSNNPSSNGRAFIDLRGLGTGRNLILIDGRRGMGSTAGGVVDVNTIPSALIERVEVITGGAAAVYGADAIAGVVNFIMRKNFSGVEIDGQYGIAEEGDGIQQGADITMGGNFVDGRGNAVFNLSYYKRDGLFAGEREFSRQATSATGSFPGGSVSGLAGVTQDEVNGIFGAGNCSVNAAFAFNPDGSMFCVGTAGNSNFDVFGYNGPDSWIATFFYPDFFSYNFAPDNYLVLPMERWNFFTRSEFEVNEYFKPYGQASFTNYNATQELAPTPGAIGAASGAAAAYGLIPVTNPFIPAQLAALLAARTNPDAGFSVSKRFNSFGARNARTEHNVWQAVLGAQGAIAGSWSYDFWAQYGRSTMDEIQKNNVSVPRLMQLMQAADGGASLCAGGLNVFGTAPISDACRSYVSFNAKNLTQVEQRGVEAIATGDLWQLPAGPLQAVFGVSSRSLAFDFISDTALRAGQVIGFNEQEPISGKVSYTDYFTELSIPLLADLPGVRSLSISPAFRLTDNDRFGNAESWKITADWAIVDSFRVRGGFQRAVRAPSVSELFAPQTNGFPAATDPCAAANATAQVKTLCGQQYGPAGAPDYTSGFSQVQNVSGGNPNLDPETADSWTAGVVFSSTSSNPWLQNLTVTADYWSIKLMDTITSFATQTVINRCYNLAANANPTYDPNNSYCQLFIRDPSANGRISELQAALTNLGTRDLAGVDVTIDYRLPESEVLGAFGFNLTVGYLDKWTSQDGPSDPVYDYAGTIGTGVSPSSSRPEWGGSLATRWAKGPVSAVLTARYIDSMFHNQIVENPALVGVVTGTPSVWYFDLTGSYAVTDQITLRGGINNLFDKQPPFYDPNQQSNTDPSTYDVLGRRYFLGANVRF